MAALEWVNSHDHGIIGAGDARRDFMSCSEEYISPESFANLLCSLSPGAPLGRVDYKFVKNMLTGIHQTQSVNLTAIAKVLNENVRLHATHKRLSRNLDNPYLNECLSQALLSLAAERVSPDTRLIVHLYEIKKKYACKIEHMTDAQSESEPSFKVCEILASDAGSGSYSPMLATVWSDRTPGFESDAVEIKRAVFKVLEATEGRGMLYYDDKSLSGEMLRPSMEESAFDFIAMIRDTEIEVEHEGDICLLQSLAETIDTRYGKIMFKLVPDGWIPESSKMDMDLFLHVGAQPIKFPGNPRRLNLISLKSKNRLVGEISAPLITSRTRLRSRKTLMGLVEAFLSMQDVIEVHQSLRDRYDPSGFRVLTFDRLQLLMTMLQSTIFYETSVLGSGSVEDHVFSHTPHDGDLNRTYYRPEGDGEVLGRG